MSDSIASFFFFFSWGTGLAKQANKLEPFHIVTHPSRLWNEEVRYYPGNEWHCYSQVPLKRGNTTD